MPTKKVGRNAKSGRFFSTKSAKQISKTVVVKKMGALQTITVTAETLSSLLGVTRRDLAETVGLSAATLQRKARAQSPTTTARLTEMAEIINRVSEWAGGERQAFAWYRSQPIPAFGGRTAESLVKSGKAAALRDYLDHLALGGFA